MQRRHFLAGTAALAASPVVDACISVRPYGIDPDIGSSVSPLGKLPRGTTPQVGYGTSAYCPQPVVRLPSYIPYWPAGKLQEFDYEAYLLGTIQKPLPSSTIVVNGPGDPWFQTQLEPGQYADFTELFTWMAGGAVASGVAQTGSHSYAWRNGAGVAIAGAAWIGWNIGTFIHLNGVQVDSAIRSVGLGPWMSGLSSSQGDALRAQIGSGGGILIIRLR